MKRTIWPVGHGAFYTEVFHGTNRNISVVYDCGGRSNDTIRGCIDNYIHGLSSDNNGNPIVDCVFISHFHQDHIRGLQYLLDNANVKNLVIPQIGDKLILVEAYIYNAILGEAHNSPDLDSPAQAFIYKLATSNRDMDVHIVEIEDANSDNKGADSHNLANEDNTNQLGKSLASGSSLQIYKHRGDIIWEYVPVNIFNKDDQKIKKLIEGLEALVSDRLDLKPIVTDGHIDFVALNTWLKGDYKKIKDVYVGIFGEQKANIYSMPVYSGPVKEMRDRFTLEVLSGNIFDAYPGMLRRFHYDIIWARAFARDWSKRACACLYMGDFEPKNKLSDGTLFVEKMKKILGDRWHYLGMQQIPHHASPNNYSPILYDHPKLCFANVNNHQDRSCSFKVLQDIVSCDCLPTIVTETEESIFRCEIW